MRTMKVADRFTVCFLHLGRQLNINFFVQKSEEVMLNINTYIKITLLHLNDVHKLFSWLVLIVYVRKPITLCIVFIKQL